MVRSNANLRTRHSSSFIHRHNPIALPMNLQAALFDLDGTLFDTEGQYTIYWEKIGRQYHPEIADFAHIIKGTTLVNILDTYFNTPALQKEIVQSLNEHEAKMRYHFMPGAVDFLNDLRSHGVKMAVVTSSNKQKMARVEEQMPEFATLFDCILTAEHFAHSKPHPDCYLKGAATFGLKPQECVVFEDAYSGLAAGMAAGMFTFGITTCNPREAIEDKCSYVIDTFEDLSYQKVIEITKNYE